MYGNTANFINVNKRFSKHSTAFQSVTDRSFNILSLADIITLKIRHFNLITKANKMQYFSTLFW